MRHVFALAAYGESKYLAESLSSLLAQTRRSKIIICTSTPSRYIEEIALRYAVPLYVREGKSGLSADWNYCIETAADKCGGTLITVAHQDDIYDPKYAEGLYNAAGRYPDMSLFCTDARVIDAGGARIRVSYENVKRLLRLPLRLKPLNGTRFIKRLPLIYGNAIVAPSCTYNIELTGLPVFEGDDAFVTDWKASLRLADMPGRIVCLEKPLVSYRVHEDAASKSLTLSGRRAEEEYEVFSSCHTEPIARLLMHFYRGAYSAYD